MELSLEKIELVKDRTGVSYREAKDALIKADGSVVDAIILLEDEIDVSPKTAAGVTASDIVSTLRELVHKGNVEKILVRKDDETVLNIPVNIGLLGAFILPEAAIISAVIALGTKCSISVVGSDGSEVDVVKKVSDKLSDVKETYSDAADDIAEKGSSAFSKLREKADTVISKMAPSDAEDDFMDDDYFNFDDEYPDLDEEADVSEPDSETEPEENEQEEAPEAEEDDPADAAVREASEALEEASEAVSEAEDAVSDSAESFDDAGEKFENTINSYKEKKNKFF
ncbi:MAG: DUF4342 domain-containing protein [Anaerovoracaceae bacterium]|jgi:hypothetical protein|nr:DUF4342 domain-containing protein [Bacillota bacterium]MDY2670307.1 DUF4342 domain-containing protein [Anaerovoracaceae bacterium]